MNDDINAPMTTEEAHQAMVKLVRENRAMQHVAKILEAALQAEQGLADSQEEIANASKRLAEVNESVVIAERKRDEDLANIKKSIDMAISDSRQVMADEMTKTELAIKMSRDEANQQVYNIAESVGAGRCVLAKLKKETETATAKLDEIQRNISESEAKLTAIREAIAKIAGG